MNSGGKTLIWSRWFGRRHYRVIIAVDSLTGDGCLGGDELTTH